MSSTLVMKQIVINFSNKTNMSSTSNKTKSQLIILKYNSFIYDIQLPLKKLDQYFEHQIIIFHTSTNCSLHKEKNKNNFF